MSEPELLAIRDPAAYWGQRALAAELACAEARAEAERLREALQWYADADFLDGAERLIARETLAALSTPDTPGAET